jgi:hypothetical protein
LCCSLSLLQMFPDELGDEEAASEEEEDPGTEDEEA